MDSGYIVELAGEAAGVLVGAGGVYEFHAVDPRFRSLEGAVFDNGFAAERAVRRLARHGAGSRRNAAVASIPSSAMDLV